MPPEFVDFARFLIYAVPVLITLAALEGVVLALTRKEAYDWRAALASLADFLLREFLVRRLLPLGLAAPVIAWVWQNRLTTVQLDTVSAFALLFLGQEFCYYWFHRASHRVRWFWAAHVNHHTSQHYNLSTALRQTWTGPLALSFVFRIWPAFVGVPPEMLLTAGAANTVGQFWIHTEAVRRMPAPLEWVFNTPSHHRAHHASDQRWLDCNFGGVLIVFDRLFGTFVAEPDEGGLTYGLVEPIRSNNPFRIALTQWVVLLQAVFASGSVKAGLGVLLAPPASLLKPASA